MLNLILLLIYVSTILAVIFLERKNPTEALLWVLVMVCMPFFGVLLYLIFGSTSAFRQPGPPRIFWPGSSFPRRTFRSSSSIPPTTTAPSLVTMTIASTPAAKPTIRRCSRTSRPQRRTSMYSFTPSTTM